MAVILVYGSDRTDILFVPEWVKTMSVWILIHWFIFASILCIMRQIRNLSRDDFISLILLVLLLDSEIFKWIINWTDYSSVFYWFLALFLVHYGKIFSWFKLIKFLMKKLAPSNKSLRIIVRNDYVNTYSILYLNQLLGETPGGNIDILKSIFKIDCFDILKFIFMSFRLEQRNATKVLLVCKGYSFNRLSNWFFNIWHYFTVLHFTNPIKTLWQVNHSIISELVHKKSLGHQLMMVYLNKWIKLLNFVENNGRIEKKHEQMTQEMDKN